MSKSGSAANTLAFEQRACRFIGATPRRSAGTWNPWLSGGHAAKSTDWTEFAANGLPSETRQMQSNLPGSDQALDHGDAAAFLTTTRPVFSKGLPCKKAEWLNRSRGKAFGEPEKFRVE
jgi:hypothetical protein